MPYLPDKLQQIVHFIRRGISLSSRYPSIFHSFDSLSAGFPSGYRMCLRLLPPMNALTRKRYLALALFTSISCLKTASTSPSPFNRRDFCDTLYCTPDLWGTTSAFFDENVLPYLQPDWDQSPAKTPSQNTDIEINVVAPPSNQEECSTNAPTDFNSQSDQGNTIPGSCLQTSQVTVWPNSCGDELQNKETARILAEMVPAFLTSINPICAAKDSVLF